MSPEQVALIIIGTLMSILATVAIFLLKQLVAKIDSVVKLAADLNTRVAILESRDIIRKEVITEMSRHKSSESSK